MSELPTHFDLVLLQTLNGAGLGVLRSAIPASDALAVLQAEQIAALRGEHGAGVIVLLRPTGPSPAERQAEIAALVAGVRHYIIQHNLMIGECVAWNVLKKLVGVGESSEEDRERWTAYQQQKGTAFANYYRPRTKKDGDNGA